MNHIQAIMQSAAARRKPIIYKQLKNESKTLEQEALGKMGSIRLEDCEETSLKVNCKVCNITCLNCKSIVIEVSRTFFEVHQEIDHYTGYTRTLGRKSVRCN